MPADSYWPLRKYQELYARSMEDPEAFWADEARKLEWFRPWETPRFSYLG